MCLIPWITLIKEVCIVSPRSLSPECCDTDKDSTCKSEKHLEVNLKVQIELDNTVSVGKVILHYFKCNK